MKKRNFQKSTLIEKQFTEPEERIPYNSDLKLEPEELAALEEQTALLRIVRFTVNNNSEYIKSQIDPEELAEKEKELKGDLGKGKFLSVEFNGDEDFTVDVYRAVKKIAWSSETFRTRR